MFSSKSFLGFVFKSMNYFEFIFIYDMRFRSRFFFIACGCVGVPAPLIEKTVLFPLIAFGALSKIFRHTCVGAISEFPVCFIDPCVCPPTYTTQS